MKESSLDKQAEDQILDVRAVSEKPETDGFDEGRRKFSRLGFAAPLVMGLASRPVLAGNCLSNILSGNLSDPDRGACQCGWSPGGWRNPVGEINGMATLDAWALALNDIPLPPGSSHPYGSLPDPNNLPIGYPQSCVKGNGTIKNKRECYVGGVTLAQTPLAACYGGDTRPLRQILDEDSGSNLWHCVAAYLNAKLSEKDGSFTYILTVDQVVALCCGGPVPGGWSLNDFLDFTWCEPHGTLDYSFPG